jgi:hypothetical protein
MQEFIIEVKNIALALQKTQRALFTNGKVSIMFTELYAVYIEFWVIYSVVSVQKFELAKEGSAHHFVGLEPALGVSRLCIRRRIQCWFDRQYMIRLQDLAGTLRQARVLIWNPRTAARTTLLSFNRAQCRVVIGLLTGRNTLRRHLHIMGPMDSPLCRKCGAGEETSAHVWCECEALATLGHIYLGSFFLYPEDIRVLSLGAI